MKFVSLCRAVLVGGAAIIATGMLAGSARAIPFDISSGCSQCGGAVSAHADVTLGTNSLTVVLTNTATDPASLSLGQLLSGFDITFGTPISAGSLGALTQAGSLIDVSAGPTPPLGTVSSVAGSPTHWGAAVDGSGTVFIATAGLGSQSGNPINMIINGTASTLFTTDGIKNSNQQPYIQGAGTFTLAIQGLTSATKITSVSFEFGTGPEADFVVVPSPIAGAGLPGLVMACGGLVALARRRRQKIV